jgi:hypothetical protein
MVRTVVLIGAFSGELNNIRQAIAGVDADFRIISFLQHDDAMKILMKDHVLIPDILVVDDTVPTANPALLKTIREDGEAVTLILFTRKDRPATMDHSRRIYSFPKSPVRKDYADFLVGILGSRVPDTN